MDPCPTSPRSGASCTRTARPAEYAGLQGRSGGRPAHLRRSTLPLCAVTTGRLAGHARPGTLTSGIRSHARLHLGNDGEVAPLTRRPRASGLSVAARRTGGGGPRAVDRARGQRRPRRGRRLPLPLRPLRARPSARAGRREYRAPPSARAPAVARAGSSARARAGRRALPRVVAQWQDADRPALGAREQLSGRRAVGEAQARELRGRQRVPGARASPPVLGLLGRLGRALLRDGRSPSRASARPGGRRRDPGRAAGLRQGRGGEAGVRGVRPGRVRRPAPPAGGPGRALASRGAGERGDAGRGRGRRDRGDGARSGATSMPSNRRLGRGAAAGLVLVSSRRPRGVARPPARAAAPSVAVRAHQDAARRRPRWRCPRAPGRRTSARGQRPRAAAVPAAPRRRVRRSTTTRAPWAGGRPDRALSSSWPASTVGGTSTRQVRRPSLIFQLQFSASASRAATRTVRSPSARSSARAARTFSKCAAARPVTRAARAAGPAAACCPGCPPGSRARAGGRASAGGGGRLRGRTARHGCGLCRAIPASKVGRYSACLYWFGRRWRSAQSLWEWSGALYVQGAGKRPRAARRLTGCLS